MHPLLLFPPWQVHQILPALRMLRANRSLARTIARNGRRFAHHVIRFTSVLAYFRRLLAALAAKHSQSVVLAPGFQLIRSNEELMDFTQMCDCDATPAGTCVSSRIKCCHGYNCPTKRLGCSYVRLGTGRGA